MATRLLLPLAVVLGTLFLPISARPCKTLFVSSFSFSVPRNPNDPFTHHPSSGYVTVFTEITEINPINRPIFQRIPFNSEIQQTPHRKPVSPFWVSSSSSSSYDFTSLRDRTKDILSVVVALLFGVGCGALTAATMYLAWSLFYNRFGYQGSSFDEYYDDVDESYDDASPKKIGYVKIPAPDSKPEKEGA